MFENEYLNIKVKLYETGHSIMSDLDIFAV